MKVFEGDKPDLTPAQVVAIVLAGVPMIATLLSAFEVYTLSEDQQAALSDALQWAILGAFGLFGADAGLRAARNNATARVTTAGLSNPQQPPDGLGHASAAVAVPLAPNDDLYGARLDLDSDLDDEEEFGGVTMYDAHDLTNGQHEYESTLPDDEDEFDPDADFGPESRLQPVGAEDEEDLL